MGYLGKYLDIFSSNQYAVSNLYDESDPGTLEPAENSELTIYKIAGAWLVASEVAVGPWMAVVRGRCDRNKNEARPDRRAFCTLDTCQMGIYF